MFRQQGKKKHNKPKENRREEIITEMNETENSRDEQQCQSFVLLKDY